MAELKPAHEVIVAEIEKFYKGEEQDDSIHIFNVAYDTLCKILSSMVIPKEKLPWVIGKLEDLLTGVTTTKPKTTILQGLIKELRDRN